MPSSENPKRKARRKYEEKFLIIHVRVTLEQYEKLKLLAAQENLSPTTYSRQVIANHLDATPDL